jgi:hypothetical protein
MKPGQVLESMDAVEQARQRGLQHIVGVGGYMWL